MRSGQAARRDSGFTLIEMVTALAVAGALAAMIGVVVSRALQSSREGQTQEQVRRIYNAVVGDPTRGSFGYLGDMGRLPATLSELVTQGGQTAFHTTSHEGTIGYGWRGPYLTSPFTSTDLFTDAWGQTLSYTNSGGTAGQIISGGPDGTLSNADDISYPVQIPVNTTGKLLVTVTVNQIPQPSGLSVSVYSASNGDQGTAVTQTTAVAGAVPFSFTVPHGPSAIKVTHTQGAITVTRTVTVQVAAGTQTATTISMSTSATVSM